MSSPATDPYVELLREQVAAQTRVESLLDSVPDRLEAIERLLERFVRAEEQRVAILAAREARRVRNAELRAKADQATRKAAEAGQERCVTVFQRALDFGAKVIATPWFGAAVPVLLGAALWWLGYVGAPATGPRGGP